MKRYERPEITQLELDEELMAYSEYEDIEPGAGDVSNPIIGAKEHSVWEEWDYWPMGGELFHHNKFVR